jgi:peptide/nickel transport system substrate-binding protein
MGVGRRSLWLCALAGALLVAAGSVAGAARTGAAKGGGSGILRLGTTNYIDSLNPFNYIESQASNAMIMIYPTLVAYKYGAEGYQITGDWATSWSTSQGGKVWTFKLHPGTKWSDGQPMTAADGAWTVNTIVKYQKGPTAVAAPSVAHATGASAPNPTTLVIRYSRPVGNVLAQLGALFILPQHVWQPLAANGGKELKTYHPELHLPMVTGGAYTVKQYEKKGTTAFIADPNYWGPPSHADAVALTYYTNGDPMIADLKGGKLDWVDQVPFNAINVVKRTNGIVLDNVPGFETTNITWNSNPRKPKNRELLDPRVKRALSMCVNRDQIISVVFSGYAAKVETLLGDLALYANPHLGPLRYDCAAANKMLDKLGYKRGPGGIRVAPATTGKNAQPAHPMAYDVITPTSTDFNVNREFQIVKEGFAKAGVKVTQKVGGDSTASYALETGSKCDPDKSIGYTGFDIAMWDWIGYIDPDFMLSVVTKGQWCSWSDTGWDNTAYDKLYESQGFAVDPQKRKSIVWTMQKMIYDNVLYTQLVEERAIDAHSSKWTGIQTALNGFAKAYYTSPRKT